MKKPLRRTEEGLIISEDSQSTLSWKQSLRMLHNAHHVYQSKHYLEHNEKVFCTAGDMTALIYINIVM